MRRVIFAFLFLSTTALALESPVEWTMIQVCDAERQADAHLLKFPDHQIFLIDTGRNGKQLLPFLKGKGITHVNKILISHPHDDHYGGILDLLDAGIKVDEVYLELPPRELCAYEVWGCNFGRLEKILESASKHGTAWKSFKPGQVLYKDAQARLEVLYAYDGVNTPIGKTDINDMSAQILLTVGKTRALFTGDLNARLGKYLADRGKNLTAQLLKVPHHGTEGVAPDDFFDKVGAKVVFVPAPEALWKSDRSKRIREYFEKKGIPVFVSGIDGNVTVGLDAAGYQITNSSGKMLRVGYH